MGVFRFCSWMVVVLILFSTPLWSQDKDKDNKGKTEDKKKDEAKKDEKKDEKKAEKKTAEKTPSEKWIPAGQWTGIIREVRESDRSMVLTITEKALNPAAVQQLQSAMMTARMAQSPQARVQAQRGIMRAQQTLFQDKATDVEYLLKDDVKIRQANPPEAFDDKGRLKKYTAKELQELKGSEKGLKGFPADFGSLTAQQLVTVSLAYKAEKKAPPPKKDADPIVARELRPRVAMVMILGAIENKK
ncbi:MAG: hypothetical protein EXR99_02115 [Gemmataceae bacterium]|nr:hypothetical protein [Gemmataceae bacterium]